MSLLRNNVIIRCLKYFFDSNDLPWMWPLPPWADPRHRALRQLRRVARGKLRTEVIARFGRLRMCTQVLAWPAVSTLKAVIAVRKDRLKCCAAVRQFGSYCWLQWIHNLRISDQRKLFLIDLPQRRHVLGYMQWRENQALINLTKDRHRGYPDVHEKQGFARFCTEHNFPTPRPLAEGADSQCRIISPWPQTDLFLKPANLGWGKGVEVLSYQESDSSWRGVDDDEITPETIARYTKQRLPGEPWVLQNRVKNAKSWSPFTTGGLATVRVITGRAGREASPQLITAILKMPRKGAITDNSSSGGIVSTLDHPTGRLSFGRGKHHPKMKFTHNPATNYVFTGKVLPGYQEIISLALSGHEKAGEWTTTGLGYHLHG